MKRTALLIITLCLAVLPATGPALARLKGQAKIDSMKAALPQVQADTARTILLSELSFAYRNINTDSGIAYGERGLALAEKTGWRKGIGLLNDNLSVNYTAMADYTAALEYGQKALAIFEELKDPKLLNTAYSNIGAIYTELGDHRKALEYLGQALRYGKDFPAKQASDHVSLGNLYMQLGDYEKSLQHHFAAARYYEQHNPAYYGNTLANIGHVYCHQGDYNQAAPILFRSLRVSKAADNGYGVNGANLYIGEMYYEAATDTAHRIVADSLISADRRVNLEKAVAYIQASIADSRKNGHTRLLTDGLKSLSEVLGAQGNYRDALAAYREYDVLNDSALSDDKRLKMASLETKREADLKKKQIEINRLAGIQRRNQQLLFSTGILLLTVIVLAVYRRSRAQQKTNRLQQELLQQKEMLMKEIHHRVKNNLQVVSTLLDLQLDHVADLRAKDAITESAGRLTAISVVHEQLYRDDHITTIDCGPFIDHLHQQVYRVFRRDGQHTDWQNEATGVVLDVDTAVPLGLIINELMTNSYKYAFREGRNAIRLAIRKAGAGYRLEYTDSGPGMPPHVDIDRLRSLGMKIIRSLSRQLGGAFSYDREQRRFVVLFRDQEGRKGWD